ncbi:MAG: hypothetical protein ACREQA_04195 [Candidatus Binatia bacterium]
MKILVLTGLVMLGVSLTILADILLKKSSFEHADYFVAGLLLYASVAVPVALAFRMTEFGWLFIIWEAVTVILGLLAASLFFGEALNSQKVIALMLSVAAIALAYVE